MELTGENYSVSYAQESETVTFTGIFRLFPMDYDDISRLLNQIASDEPESVTLDLRALEYLNSSGISMLTSFIIKLRKMESVQLIIKGNSSYPWQNYATRNFQRLMPGLTLNVD